MTIEENAEFNPVGGHWTYDPADPWGDICSAAPDAQGEHRRHVPLLPDLDSVEDVLMWLDG